MKVSLDEVLATRRRHTESGPVLDVSDVRLEFGGLRALDDLSFSVMPGELFALIGPNGAGKTSTLNVLSGVYRPTQGTVRFLGEKVNGLRPDVIARRGLARTFQNLELFAGLTALDNILLGRHRHVRYGLLAAAFYAGRGAREERRHREVAEHIVEFLELEPYRLQPVNLLPYGIQKRVELGRALAAEPELLLLDEPVAGMNVEETEDMARFILDVRNEFSIPMVLIEHDMGLVMDLADRVLVLNFGKPITTDVPATVQQHPEVIRAYLGGANEPGDDVGPPAQVSSPTYSL